MQSFRRCLEACIDHCPPRLCQDQTVMMPCLCTRSAGSRGASGRFSPPWTTLGGGLVEDETPACAMHIDGTRLASGPLRAYNLHKSQTADRPIKDRRAKMTNIRHDVGPRRLCGRFQRPSGVRLFVMEPAVLQTPLPSPRRRHR